MHPKDIATAVSDGQKLIARFSTYYGDSKPNRKDNVALACRKIDGTVLYPEDEFSFNDIVGRVRSKTDSRARISSKTGNLWKA